MCIEQMFFFTLPTFNSIKNQLLESFDNICGPMGVFSVFFMETMLKYFLYWTKKHNDVFFLSITHIFIHVSLQVKVLCKPQCSLVYNCWDIWVPYCFRNNL